MRLTELNPRWLVDSSVLHLGYEPPLTVNFDIMIPGIRYGMGITFDCPHCRTQRLAIAFANPMDGGAKGEHFARHWQRAGIHFETLSVTPSIDASATGHWHGWITDGEIK
jgi:hypothetical protein